MKEALSGGIALIIIEFLTVPKVWESSSSGMWLEAILTSLREISRKQRKTHKFLLLWGGEGLKQRRGPHCFRLHSEEQKFVVFLCSVHIREVDPLQPFLFCVFVFDVDLFKNFSWPRDQEKVCDGLSTIYDIVPKCWLQDVITNWCNGIMNLTTRLM